MKLVDILEVANENKTLRVLKNDNKREIASYDGKESIPKYLNDTHVTGLSASDDELIVYVDGEMEL